MPPFDATAALLGGALGTIAMTAVWLALAAAGALRLNWPLGMGSWFYTHGRKAAIAGWVWHAAMGLLFGPFYAGILTRWGVAPTWASGAALGCFHAALALAWLAPLTRFQKGRRGRDLAGYALGYPVFGLVFGAAYHAAPGVDPAHLAVAAVLVLAGLITLAVVRTSPTGGLVFAGAEPDLAERRAALEAARSAGRISEAEYGEAIADLESDPPMV